MISLDHIKYDNIYEVYMFKNGLFLRKNAYNHQGKRKTTDSIWASATGFFICVFHEMWATQQHIFRGIHWDGSLTVLVVYSLSLIYMKLLPPRWGNSLWGLPIMTQHK